MEVDEKERERKRESKNQLSVEFYNTLTEYFPTHTHNHPKKTTYKFYGISTIHTQRQKRTHTHTHIHTKETHTHTHTHKRNTPTDKIQNSKMLNRTNQYTY